MASIYYHTDVSASGNAALAREIQIGRFNPAINVNVDAHVHAVADLGFLIPTYVFATPFLGGQASASVVQLRARKKGVLVWSMPAPASSAIPL